MISVTIKHSCSIKKIKVGISELKGNMTVSQFNVLIF